MAPRTASRAVTTTAGFVQLVSYGASRSPVARDVLSPLAALDLAADLAGAARTLLRREAEAKAAAARPAVDQGVAP